MSEQDELLTQFKDITGSTDDNAKFFLELSSWSLQDAISSFYENRMGSDNVSDSTPETLSKGSAARGTSTGTISGATPGESSSSSEFKKTFKPKIATLHNMSRESSDEEEEGQAFYAGGSERSGQQVLGSPKRANIREQLTNMFRMAHEQGSLGDLPLESEPRPTAGSASASGSSSQRSWGVGLRLGQTDTDHSAIVEEPAAGGPRIIQNVILRLWSQGFTINNGELRHYENPDNKKFLETVIRGEIPAELRKMGTQVGVDVEDHRHESYKKPATVVKTFNGAGNTLGSPQPTVQEFKTEEQTTVVDDKANEAEAAKNTNVNSSEPTTSVQIRLSDGSRMAAQFNLSHTIDDIRQYIVIARPQYSTLNFILVTSFPTKELNNGATTIEEAKLQNAVIMQRLK